MMDNSPPGINDKRSLVNGPSFRRSPNSRPDLHHHHHHHPYTTITIHKDDKGYGMKVSGDNPVYVQSVKEGGAAERAGLHSGDTIVKVNGVNVLHLTHTEVVELIKEDGWSGVEVERLKSRSLLSVDGRDSFVFLRDLCTNDMKHLMENKKCLYTAFLNSKGKVLYDAMIYRAADRFLVECDACALEPLLIHLFMCKRNKKVNLANVEKDFSVWAVYSPSEEPLLEMDLGKDVIVCSDPRVDQLGLRAIAPRGLNLSKVISSRSQGHDELYRLLRYRLGVSEGSWEIPYGLYSPWEVNMDYLRGMSSEPGRVFLGSGELEKSTWRPSDGRRMMPISLRGSSEALFPLNTPIQDAARRKRTPVGFLRGIKGVTGLAIMRVSKVFKEDCFRIGNLMAHCSTPFWWPQNP